MLEPNVLFMKSYQIEKGIELFMIHPDSVPLPLVIEVGRLLFREPSVHGVLCDLGYRPVEQRFERLTVIYARSWAYPYLRLRLWWRQHFYEALNWLEARQVIAILAPEGQRTRLRDIRPGFWR